MQTAFLDAIYQPMISRIRVRTRKAAPNHLVLRASLASRVLALFLDRKESEIPPTTPDRPALLPDWNRTATIMIRPQISCRMVIISFKAPMTENLQKIHSCTYMISRFTENHDTIVYIDFQVSFLKIYYFFQILMNKKDS